MLELLKKRRSIRKFKEQEVPRELVDNLVKAALLSPSSKSIRPWEFVVVDDKNLLEKLATCKEHGSLFLKGAPLGIIILADETKSDVWVEDASIATIIIQLAAEQMGLGSCWIQIRNRMHNNTETAESYVKQVLEIPEKYKVEAILAIGYPDGARKPQDEDKLKYDIVYQNSFGQQYPWS